MKRILITVGILFIALIAHSQSNAIDELFDKYSDKEGFTTVFISSKMFSMFSSKDQKDQDLNNLINKLNSIRILSVGDSTLNKTINFYSELSKKVDFSVYEELMVVKSGPDITKFLIKQSGNVISELLVIIGGPGGNSLISIKGELNLKNISDLSKSLDMQELKGLDKIQKKSPDE